MSKRIGYYQNADFSSLNINDSEINTGLLDGCKIIFYTSPNLSSNAVIALNTSDSTEPRLIKSIINTDSKDNYVFNIIASKSNKGYLIQSVIGGWYLTATSQGVVNGTKDQSSVWKFIHVGGKSSLKCKLQLITTNDKVAILAEKGDYINVIQGDDDNNTQWNLGFVSFGPKAFTAMLKENKFLITECCKGKLPANLNSICTSHKYNSGSATCKEVNSSGPLYDVYDNLEERTLTVTDDEFGTTEILLGVGILILIGVSIYIMSHKK